MAIEFKKTFILLANCSKPSLSHGSLRTFDSNRFRTFCTDADDQCIAGSFAVFECDPGYVLLGFGYSRCQGRGQWYPPVPNCIGKTCNLFRHRWSKNIWY